MPSSVIHNQCNTKQALSLSSVQTFHFSKDIYNVARNKATAQSLIYNDWFDTHGLNDSVHGDVRLKIEVGMEKI